VQAYLVLLERDETVGVERVEGSGPNFYNLIEFIFMSKKIVDEIHGEYPFLLYNHYYILKERIMPFLRLKFNLNKDIPAEGLKKLNYLEHLLIHRLGPIQVSNQLFLRLCRLSSKIT